MLVLIDGVVNELPLPSKVPPVTASYQLMVPALAVAPKTKVPASHLEAGAIVETGAVITTVASTAERVLLQPEFNASA